RWATGAATIGRWVIARRSASLGTGVAPHVATAAGAGAAAGPVADPRRWALIGAMAIMSWILLGAVLATVGAGGALGGFGILIIVLGWITFGIISWFGAGAWVRSEFTTGFIGRWWAGRRRSAAVLPPPSGGPPPPPPAGEPPPPPTMPPPPPPVSPDPGTPSETYKPPGLEPPAS